MNEEGELLRVAVSLAHDHVPAKASGLPSVLITRGARGIIGVPGR